VYTYWAIELFDVVASSEHVPAVKANAIYDTREQNNVQN
jgi:hypothetical protein